MGVPTYAHWQTYRARQDTGVALRVWYVKEATSATVEVDASNNVILVVNGGTPVTIDDAGQTMGDIIDAINAEEGWRAQGVAARRADGADAALLTQAATSALQGDAPDGVDLLYDTSGSEADTNLVTTGVGITSANPHIPRVAENRDFVGRYKPEVRELDGYINAIAKIIASLTTGTQDGTVEIYSINDVTNEEEIKHSFAVADGTTVTVDFLADWGFALQGNVAERLSVRLILDGAGVSSVSELDVWAMSVPGNEIPQAH